MSRAIVYPKKGEAGVAYRGALPAGGAGPLPPDKWGDKLIKYVPAEVIAFYIPVYALLVGEGGEGAGATINKGAIYGVVGACVVGTVGYLFVGSDKTNPPRWYFYVLAALAFLAWALGTSTLGTDLGILGEVASKVTLLGAVFLVPMFDEALTRWLS